MRRTQRLAVAGLVVLAATGLLVFNAGADEGPTTLGVSDAKRDAGALLGQPIAVRGFIEEGTIVYNGTMVETFVIADQGERLWVRYGQNPPDAFGAKDVVVYGSLSTLEDGTVVLDADSVFVGCASKY